MTRVFPGLIASLLLIALPAAARDMDTTAPSGEDFHVELNLWGWQFDPTGTLQGSDTTLDLINDLGVRQQVKTWYGQVIFKPGRKHRIIVEGTPLRVSGSHIATKTFTYNDQTFTFNEELDTRANLNYFFGGYQYDFVSGSAGHVGASVGAAYLSATGSITAPQADLTSSKSQKIGLPLAGIEGRLFPIPGHPFVDVDGGVRGMDFGSYGHYVEFNINGGIWVLNHIGIHAGYRETRAFLQDNSTNNNGSINLHLTGPTVEVSFKW